MLNPGNDVQVGLVTDAAWISPTQPAGITLQAVRLNATGIEPAPGVVVGGVGVRFSRSSGPLVEAGITVDAVSLLGFGLVQAARQQRPAGRRRPRRDRGHRRTRSAPAATAATRSPRA